ncbi:hypothetical protein [Phytohabitans rumicis]|uniref:DUF2637 domain-containing protein n=1 Tax=Phytohabitans rumicis TaxID=1076125 RepID=A0A6V8KY73_9ACTN|nr:hypothetical protein [Phytohabitans rumicis]GFJ88774.1 hypothetical protein Prum_024160 [Phytohabitans rumicis]
MGNVRGWQTARGDAVAYGQTSVNGRSPTVATLDAALERAVRRASVMRQGFYVVVLLVALAGQVSGAVEALGIPLAAAIPAVAALELGGIVVLANADVRRRLGERAIGSRLLSAAIAVGAVAFNWLAHDDHLLGGFFAGMSALGYLVWLTHTENQRRDRLRATGDLPPTTPAYEVVGHWLRHPWLTNRAKSLAKANPDLGLYGSIAAAQDEIRRNRRRRAIAKVLHRKIRAAVDPTTADIALAVYDLEEIAGRLASQADYDGLTALIAADLAPARLAPSPSSLATSEPAPSPADTSASEQVEPPSAALTETTDQFRVLAAVRRELEELQAPGRSQGPSSPRRRPRTPEPPAPAPSTPLADEEPEPVSRTARRDRSLRSRVHAALDRHAPVDGRGDSTQLVDLVTDVLQLDDVERISAATYVQTWQRDAGVPIPQQARP